MNATEKELEGIINRDFLRKQVKNYILAQRTELLSKITVRVIEKCLIFVSGYVRCFKYYGIQPINMEEFKLLLLQECFDWVIEYIEEGGR